MMPKTTHVEALLQTPEQRLNGSVTFRAYIDDAWRNVEGLTAWKQLTQKELVQLIEEVYEKNKPKANRFASGYETI